MSSYELFRKADVEHVGESEPFPAWGVNPIDIPIIDGDKTIWRYTTIPKLVNSIRKINKTEQAALHLTQTSWFDDEDDFEGTVPEPTIETHRANLERLANSDSDLDVDRHLEKTYGGQDPEVEETEVVGGMERMRDLVYLNCWACMPTESNPMWRAYSNRNTGIAIKSTVDSLISSITAWEGKVYYGAVRYEDLATLTLPLSPIQNFFLKREEFRDEREFRLVQSFKETGPMVTPTDADLMAEPPESNRSTITVDLSTLVSKIVVHPHSRGYVKKALEDILRRYDLSSVSVEHSSLRVRSESVD